MAEYCKQGLESTYSMRPFPFGYVKGRISVLADIVPALTYTGEVIKMPRAKLQTCSQALPLGSRKMSWKGGWLTLTAKS